jgi:hypothetical protein
MFGAKALIWRCHQHEERNVLNDPPKAERHAAVVPGECGSPSGVGAAGDDGRDDRGSGVGARMCLAAWVGLTS